MWARDLLIINGVAHPGEMIRRYRCHQPSTPIPASSNGVLIQIQGKDRFGKLQAISLVRCYRLNIQGDHLEIDISKPSNSIKKEEERVLREWLRDISAATYKKHEAQAVLGLCRIV